MVADANVIPEESKVEVPGAPPSEPEATSAAPQQRVWLMPMSPVARKHADEVGRGVVKVGAGLARFLRGLAGACTRGLAQVCRAVEAVPPAVRLLFAAGILALMGVVGSIALHNSLGLICAIVVVPVCSITIGVLGHRWYGGLGDQPGGRPNIRSEDVAASELRRSVEYVDSKLAVALSSFGTERHQHAVIALFQAKTAVELALGTELPTTGNDDKLLADERDLRPRIQVGTTPKSPIQHTNSLSAS